jgi:hypothetical protein
MLDSGFFKAQRKVLLKSIGGDIEVMNQKTPNS